MAKRRSNPTSKKSGYVLVPRKAFWSMKKKVDQLDGQRKRNEMLARMRAETNLKYPRLRFPGVRRFF